MTPQRKRRPPSTTPKPPAIARSHVERLRRAGMSATEARAKGRLFAQCDEALGEPTLRRRRWSVWVPGRIEILGKHTDYAGGRSILCAMERGFCARVAPRTDNVVRVTNAVDGVTWQTTLGDTATPARNWTSYVAAVARRLPANFPQVTHGADIAFSSDLPIASGASSSTALLILVFVAIAKSNQLGSAEHFRQHIASREELATYLACVENGSPFRNLAGDLGVGTLGGSQDHTAILCAEPGRLLRFMWSPTRCEQRLPVPTGHTFVVATSGVVAEKTGAARDAYNRASRAVHHLLRSWNALTYRNDSSLADAVASDIEATERLRRIATEQTTAEFDAIYLRDRLEQYLLETHTIIPHASRMLESGDPAAFGAYVAWSQWAAERLLGNQIPETAFLAASARELGAVAASAFGAGFGGSVWALVRTAQHQRFLAQWQAAYARAFPDRNASAQFFMTGSGPAALQW